MFNETVQNHNGPEFRHIPTWFRCPIWSFERVKCFPIAAINTLISDAPGVKLRFSSSFTWSSGSLDLWVSDRTAEGILGPQFLWVLLLCCFCTLKTTQNWIKLIIVDISLYWMWMEHYFLQHSINWRRLYSFQFQELEEFKFFVCMFPSVINELKDVWNKKKLSTMSSKFLRSKKHSVHTKIWSFWSYLS